MKFNLLILIPFIVLSLIGCDDVKTTTLDVIKKGIDTKEKIELALLPDNAIQIQSGENHYEVKKETFDRLKKLIHNSHTMQHDIVDFIGAELTDERLALLGHYLDELSVSPDEFLNLLKQ